MADAMNCSEQLEASLSAQAIQIAGRQLAMKETLQRTVGTRLDQNRDTTKYILNATQLLQSRKVRFQAMLLTPSCRLFACVFERKRRKRGSNTFFYTHRKTPVLCGRRRMRLMRRARRRQHRSSRVISGLCGLKRLGSSSSAFFLFFLLFIVFLTNSLTNFSQSQRHVN
jgi:hypothetical protein